MRKYDKRDFPVDNVRRHSFDMVRNSRECVINIPISGAKGIGIGNSSARDIDKFAEFGLTAVPSARVGAPLIEVCYASFECKLADARLIPHFCVGSKP